MTSPMAFILSIGLFTAAASRQYSYKTDLVPYLGSSLPPPPPSSLLLLLLLPFQFPLLYPLNLRRYF